MEHRLECKQRRVFLLDATDQDYVDLTPALGHAYIITTMYGWHDQGAPLASVWAYQDAPAGGFRNLCQEVAALASGIYLGFYTSVPSAQPFILRWGQTIRFNCTGKTAPHNVVIEAMIDEIVGETAYVG